MAGSHAGPAAPVGPPPVCEDWAVRPIRLHDTRSGSLCDLETREPGRVGIYACGPTVYNRIHIGNARPFVVFSLLKLEQREDDERARVADVDAVVDRRTAGVDPHPAGLAGLEVAQRPRARVVQADRAHGPILANRRRTDRRGGAGVAPGHPVVACATRSVDPTARLGLDI